MKLLMASAVSKWLNPHNNTNLQNRCSLNLCLASTLTLDSRRI